MEILRNKKTFWQAKPLFMSIGFPACRFLNQSIPNIPSIFGKVHAQWPSLPFFSKRRHKW